MAHRKIFAALVAVGGITVFCWCTPSAAVTAPVAVPKVSAIEVDDDAPMFDADLPPLPTDRQGTDVDGDLTVDAKGHLRLTPDVRRVFDYFLMSQGAESDATIEARVFAHLRAVLPAMAAAEGRALWRKYTSLRFDFAGLSVDPNRASSVQSVEALDELTSRHFSPAEREALFGDEMIRSRAAASGLQAFELNPKLTVQERNDAWEEVLDRLPEPEREAHIRAGRALDYLALEKQVVDDGGGAQELRAMRSQQLGAPAADRLAQLDDARAQWTTRLDTYVQDRAGIVGDSSLSAPERAAKLQALLDAQFSPAEQMRVRVLRQ